MSDLLIQQGPPPQAPPGRRRWFQRPWFFIVMAVALLAAAAVTATVLLSLPKTITVYGNVIDDIRPDQGVAAAAISTDGKTAKADATGAFEMTGVPENAVLRVSAPYYRTNTVAASAKQLTIRLTPIPVTMTVTGAMTGAPVEPTVSAPADQPVPYTITSGGVTRLYRAGPGEKLTVTADGYRAAYPVIGRDQTLTVTLEPTQHAMWMQLNIWTAEGKYSTVVNWILRPATGYTYESPTPQEEAQVTQGLHDIVDYGTVRFISENSAAVQIYIAKPGNSMDPQALAKSFGHAAPVTIAGQSAWHGGPDSTSSSVTAASFGRLDIEIYEDTTAQTDQIMTRILTAMLGPGPSIST